MILGILGPGTLGCSLARHAAGRGLEVRLLGRDEGHAARALARLGARMDAGAHARISARSAGPGALDGLDAILEALPEDLDLKAAAWRNLTPWLGKEMLLLTGTSALPVALLAREAGLAGRLLGFHLFVPVSKMAIVELVVPEGGDGSRAEELALALGLRVAKVKDQVGLAAARMALAQGLEAMRLLEAGAASAEDLDALMAEGYGHPVGPLELSDRVGLDLRLKIADTLHQATGDARFEAPALLRAMVAAGELGRKTGRGFYAWGPDGRRA